MNPNQPLKRKKLRDVVRKDGIQISRYALVGIANTITDFGIFALLFYACRMGPLWANAIAFFVAVSQSYLLNSKWTFNVREVELVKYLSFVAVSVGGLGISSLSIYVLNGLASPLVAKILAVGFVVLWGYVLSRTFVFRLRPIPKLKEQANA